MTRRLAAAFIVLALGSPIVATPVAAHDWLAFTIQYDSRADGTVVGLLTNHTFARRQNVTVTAKWSNGGPVFTDSTVVAITNLAPHATTPFVLDPDFDVTGMYVYGVNAAAPVTAPAPAGALKVDPGTLTDNTYSGTVHNDGSATASDVVVYAARLAADPYEHPTDAAASATIASIAPGASATYTIEFDASSTGDLVGGLIAQTTSGSYFTSWNNFFGDLGNIDPNFVDDIVYLAENGITTGCSATNFCPKSPVTRAQMAVFLDRAIGWPDAPLATQFTDISGLSAEAQQAIANLAANGVTSGCTADRFCPANTVTRGQMSKFIVLAYEFTVLHLDAFSDDDGHFSEDYNDTMAVEHIASGCAFEKFCPDAPALRGQMAVFIHNAETH